MSEGRDKVVVNIKAMVGQLVNGTRSMPTIFRVHNQLHQAKSDCYEPEIVSIGPIYHGKDHVKGMEDHKVIYLHQLLRRRNDVTVEDYVRELRRLEESARRCYEAPVLLNQDEFVKMLLLDGCFIIELMRKYWFNDLRDKSDLIFHSELVISQLRRDLILFENQLPFFVLDQLFDMTKSGDPEDNIRSLVLFFMDDLISLGKDVSRSVNSRSQNYDVHHLLGLVYESYFAFSARNLQETDHAQKEKVPANINNASELIKAGIQFKTSKGNTLLDLSFSDGVLYIPSLRISDHTESFWRNLIAYEQQLSCDQHKYATEYAFFMHCLIDSKHDVKILQSSGVISNWLGDDEMINLMFIGLGQNVVISSESYLYDVFERVNQFSRARRNKWVAKLKQTHCNNPWTSISVVAAFVLLVLTGTQTVFSILTFTQKH